MKSEEMSSEGGIGGMPSLEIVGRDMSMRERKTIWHKGNGSFKGNKNKSRKKREGIVSNEVQNQDIYINTVFQ